MTDAAVMDGLLLDLVSKHLAFDYVWAAASRDLYSEQSESQELFQRVYESNMLTLMSRPVLASPLLNFTIENDAIAAEFLYGADPEYVAMCGALETADFRREALKQFNTGVLVAKSRHHSGTGVSASTKMATLRLISFPGVTAYSDSLKTNERDRSTAEKHKMKAFEFTIHKKSHLISEAQTAIHDGPPRSEIEVGVWHGVQALLWAELVNSVPHPPQFSVALVCWINHLQWPCKEVPEDPGVSWLDLFVDFRLATGVLAPIAEGSFEGKL